MVHGNIGAIGRTPIPRTTAASRPIVTMLKRAIDQTSSRRSRRYADPMPTDSPTSMTPARAGHYRMLATPTGPFFVTRDADGSIETGWRDMLDGAGGGGRTITSIGLETPGLLPDLCDRIIRAMNGHPVDFADIATPAGTGFQRTVWNATRAVGFGSTLTYGELARRVGRPKAARAIGQAMRRNRLPIVIPCHRIIGAADLGGFGGTGVGTNRWNQIKTSLLAAERGDRGEKSGG